jgi:hypothetical protein
MVIAAFDARAARALRVSLDQSLSTFAALQRRGIESQLLYFPDENHWALKPQNSLQWRDTVHAWLKKYIGPRSRRFHTDCIRTGRAASRPPFPIRFP